jgi:hypothetical protein
MTCSHRGIRFFAVPKAAARVRQQWVYSVEKLISCAQKILQINSVAENQAQTRALGYIEQLSAEIVGSCRSFTSFKCRPFEAI